MREKYTIGIDFGTESGRAVVINTATGDILASHVTPFKHGVITRQLPGSHTPLDPEWALQHPDDYLDVLFEGIPSVLEKSSIPKEDVIGIGIDFTSSTMVPVDAALNPMCKDPRWADHPHAWVKLWKHHGCREESRMLDERAKEEDWYGKYGSKISVEWMIPKALEILRNDPAIYEATDLFLEAGDWIVSQLTGKVLRNNCAAGFKSFWNREAGYPTDYFRDIHPELGRIEESKLRGRIVQTGIKAGQLTPRMADKLGLRENTAVSTAIIDAHSSLVGLGITDPGHMVMVMGTSTCHLTLGKKEIPIKGISGVVEDGIIPGYYAYEAGQSAVGDIFAWFIQQIPEEVSRKAEQEGISEFKWLEKKAAMLRPGESGLLALDWHNGNRSTLANPDLSGLILGLNLETKPEEIFRALMEATAFGAKKIMEAYENGGIEIQELHACGGLPQQNKLLMQIYADITNRRIKVCNTGLTPAIGAAILGAVAAGPEEGGYPSIPEATKHMVLPKDEIYRPNTSNVTVYQQLYREYTGLHDYFGKASQLMERVKSLKYREGNSQLV